MAHRGGLRATVAVASLVLAQLAPLPAPTLPLPLATAPAAAATTSIVSCYSRGQTRRICSLPGAPVEVRYLGPDASGRCAEGQTWGWSGARLWVTNGCGGDFRVTLAGGSGGFGGSGGSWQGNGYAGELRCRSDRGRERFCRADARGRAVLVEDLSGGLCLEGQTWRAESRGIRVRGNCDARFAYGYGSFFPSSWQQGGLQPDRPGHGGANVGGVIAGAALAAGLIALLSQAGRPTHQTGGSAARVEANMRAFPDRSRREAGACLDEAARQVGATGGTLVRLDDVLFSRQQPGGGWRHEARLTGFWPDHRQRMVMDCVASGDRVSAFDVR